MERPTAFLLLSRRCDAAAALVAPHGGLLLLLDRYQAITMVLSHSFVTRTVILRV